MATNAEDVLDLDEPLTVEEPDGDERDTAVEQPDAGEELPTFGDEDEQPAQGETDLMRNLRKENRRLHRELIENRRQPQAEQPIEVGARPTIEGCEFDQERFDAEFDAWEQRKEAKRQQDAKVEQQQRQQNDAWTQVQTAYATKKAALPYADKEQVEAAAFEVLSPVQQAVIAKVAPDPALLIYAVGKNQAKLDQLAAIDDPLVLAATIGKLGATLTMKKRGPTPPDPDTPVRGSTVKSGALDKQLAALEAKASKSGDRSEIAKFKRDNKLV